MTVRWMTAQVSDHICKSLECAIIMRRKLVPTQRHSFCDSPHATWRAANALLKVVDWSCCPVPSARYMALALAMSCMLTHLATSLTGVSRWIAILLEQYTYAWQVTLGRWSPCLQAKQPSASTTNPLQLILYSSWDIYPPHECFLLHGT